MSRLTFCVLSLALATLVVADEKPKKKLAPDMLTGTRKVHVAGNVMLAGQPSKEGFEELARRGYKTVITLRHEAEERFDQTAVCEELGMKCIRMQISSPDDMDPKLLDACCKIMRDAGPESGVLLHCAGANRVGAVWLAYRVKEDGVPVQQAREEARTVGLQTKELEAKALEYVKQ